MFPLGCMCLQEPSIRPLISPLAFCSRRVYRKRSPTAPREKTNFSGNQQHPSPPTLTGGNHTHTRSRGLFGIIRKRRSRASSLLQPATKSADCGTAAASPKLAAVPPPFRNLFYYRKQNHPTLFPRRFLPQNKKTRSAFFSLTLSAA